MTITKNDYCVFILTHGRADNVKTYDTLMRSGYDGNLFIVIDNEDSQQDAYIERFGADRVVIFDKQKIADESELGDNFTFKNTIIFARNACFEIAEQLGFKYFLELDDDYTAIMARVAHKGKLKQLKLKSLDRTFCAMFEFLEESNAHTVAFSQGGDMMGGLQGKWKQGLVRKAMNSFFCSTERPFKFIGRINEDVNTYTNLGSRGFLFLSTTDAMLNQVQTQQSSGGMTEAYLDNGTYTKSFYSVIYMPSAVTITEMGVYYKRLHHSINWNKCVPKIINEKHKK